jgi:hypothetical protein
VSRYVLRLAKTAQGRGSSGRQAFLGAAQWRKVRISCAVHAKTTDQQPTPGVAPVRDT